MAKILFIGETFENLGLEYLSAVLKQNGHDTKLYINNTFFGGTYLKISFFTNLFSTSKSKLKKAIENYAPDVIAITALTDTFLEAKETANFIKSNFATPIILGGMHATLVPDYIINNTDVFDYVVTGEGEEAITDLINCITEKKSNLPANTWYKETNTAKEPTEIKPLTDLNKLPFPDKDLYYKQFKGYQKEYLIMTARGCPYSCSFCCADIWQSYYGKDFLRRKSVENVIRELKTAKAKYNPNFIWFMDDCFTMDKNWLDDFCKRYKQEINLPFFCYSNPRLITPQIAKQLKEANCNEVAIGVESLNPHILENINRTQYTEEVTQAINLLKSHNIFTATENIINLPGETKEDILSAALFYAAAKPDLVLFSYLRLFPKTKITKQYLAENKITQNDINDIYSGKGNSLATGGNTKTKIMHIQPLNLMLLSVFIPYKLMKLIIQYKLYLILIMPPTLLIKIIRLLKTLAPTSRKSYDAGLRVGMRLFVHLLKHPVTPFK